MNAYTILGISHNATEVEIKKAYRRLALEYHPDRNQGTEAAKKFREISEAYEVLGDQQKRSEHDARLHMENNSGRNHHTDPIFDHFFRHGGLHGFEDIFGAGGFGRRVRQPTQATANIDISLEEAYHGTTRAFSVDGEEIEVHIPQGVRDRETLAVRVNNFLHLNVRVGIRKHHIFIRDCEDLHCKIDVPLMLALTGGEMEVNSINGKIKLQIPSRVNSHTKLRVKDSGMRRQHHVGSTYYELKICLDSLDGVDANLAAGILSHHSDS